MTCLLVPGEADRTRASLMVGVTNGDAAAAWVEVEDVATGRRWPIVSWQRWQEAGDEAALFSWARVQVDQLTAGTAYSFALRVDGVREATASITTLPTALPPVTAPPFTVLLGSCFSVRADRAGAVGRAFVQLPGALRPQIKMLAGDQVYLDSPWYRFLRPHSATGLAQGFLRHYLDTWSQQGDLQGFGHLLSHGANFFCADDHEFWNNVPFPSSAAVNTWTAAGRHTWKGLAASLFSAFQGEADFTTFDIGELSVCRLDTRLHRRRDRSQFTTSDVLAQVGHWVAGLRAPGLLVVSQPVFATRAGTAGRFLDWNLPDFAQYAELCRVLLASRQSIIVACGDVHFGRIARATLPTGAELIEVVSSPMALVAGAARGGWHLAPDRFPADPIPGLASVRVTTDPGWRMTDDHFVTLHFHADGGGVRCGVRGWPTTAPRRVVQQAAAFVLKRNAA